MQLILQRLLAIILYATSFIFIFAFISRNSTKRRERIDEFGASWVSHLCQRRLPHLRRMAKGDHLEISWNPPGERNLFLTQTSCSTELSSRETCAVESAALHHPGRTVVLYMTSPYVNNAHPYMKVLLGIENVQINWLDLDEVFGNEPLLSWHRNRHWYVNQATAPTSVSDVVRAEFLRRWGGTYLDLDMITLRTFPEHENWIGRMDQVNVNHAASNFRKNHKLFEMAVNAIPTAFDTNDCCSVGPVLITRFLHEMCPDNVTIPDTTDPDTMEYCEDIVIYNSRAFYPFSYIKNDILSMFETRAGIGPEFFASTKAYTLHLFHSLTKSGRVISNSDSVLEEAMKRNCPRVYKTVIQNNLLL